MYTYTQTLAKEEIISESKELKFLTLKISESFDVYQKRNWNVLTVSATALIHSIDVTFIRICAVAFLCLLVCYLSFCNFYFHFFFFNFPEEYQKNQLYCTCNVTFKKDQTMTMKSSQQKIIKQKQLKLIIFIVQTY